MTTNLLSVIEQQHKALKENHQWHQDYDDLGGYPDSALETTNVAALAAGQQALEQTQGEVISGFSLAAIGRKHWGNPIPQEWYEAARELLKIAHPQATEPVNAELVDACGRYEAALMAAFPNGAHGEAFTQWNEARKLLAKRAQATAHFPRKPS